MITIFYLLLRSLKPAAGSHTLKSQWSNTTKDYFSLMPLIHVGQTTSLCALLFVQKFPPCISIILGSFMCSWKGYPNPNYLQTKVTHFITLRVHWSELVTEPQFKCSRSWGIKKTMRCLVNTTVSVCLPFWSSNAPKPSQRRKRKSWQLLLPDRSPGFLENPCTLVSPGAIIRLLIGWENYEIICPSSSIPTLTLIIQ